MRFISFLAAFGAANAAIDVQLVWRLEKDSGLTSVSALDLKKGTLLAGSCGSTLEADTPIDFSDVDKDGNGNFTVGDASYRVHSKPEFSGGPSCSKTFNAKYSLVQCSGVKWPGTPDSAKGNATDCFKDEESQTTFRALEARGLSHELHSAHRRDTHQNDERQFCSWYTTTNLVDDGDPHQNYLHKQLSETINCGTAESCSVGSMQSKSFTIGWSSDFSGVPWISGGFSVSESWTTGNSYSCNAGKGETACIWYNTAHTAYTVRETARNSCGGSYTARGPYILFSPNEQNRGGGYYCVIGTCRSQGDEYWDKSGRAGGP
ncbi:hypothetical protein CEP51_005430 [Fusarium floridanum]|uniref:Ig-like domain-containing protein n=1 Tax=Fusarium floridanum TaxID=1325733 RepID=A0A428RWU4_9HYPO|nr:hypothetical protein CEP51_005430 [Fusarium floridanum]